MQRARPASADAHGGPRRRHKKRKACDALRRNQHGSLVGARPQRDSGQEARDRKQVAEGRKQEGREGKEMFTGYYAEHVIRARSRERARELAMLRLELPPSLVEQRAVLSADWRGWSWRRARGVLGMVGLALVASVALPASLLGAAWGLRELLALVIR